MGLFVRKTAYHAIFSGKEPIIYRKYLSLQHGMRAQTKKITHAITKNVRNYVRKTCKLLIISVSCGERGIDRYRIGWKMGEIPSL